MERPIGCPTRWVVDAYEQERLQRWAVVRFPSTRSIPAAFLFISNQSVLSLPENKTTYIYIYSAVAVKTVIILT